MNEAMRFGRTEVGYFGLFTHVLAKSKASEIELFGSASKKANPTTSRS